MARNSNQIRREFIEFFEQRGHTFVPSSSLLPADDPTLLFANAGMNQFKDVFLGTGGRPFSRAVNSQKCIRAGGKHNDLEDVGHDTYHHTFFEMLGNWSFGDYFKAEAIQWAWELLTGVWGLDKDRLSVTYFGGEAAAKLDPDTEAKELWAKIAGIPAERILPGSMDDNFWEMGETGPCGPCSEIHYDFGPGNCDGKAHAGKPCAVNVSGCSRFIELWNLVFMQFNRDADGVLSPLPAKHVDTGMGFERIVRALQGKTSNYDTDIFTPLIAWLEAMSGLRYGDKADADVAFRVVADHARACTFAIADGVLPSNEGRGYVIRRILRRAARFGRKLGQHEPFLFELSGVVAEQMGDAFPELRDRQTAVAEVIRDEEQSFNRTLDRGLEIFERAAEKAQDKRLSGEVAFELYATFGFPIDLTQLMAAERGLSVDMDGYQREMAKHREVSSAGGDAFQATAITGLPETDDAAKYQPAALKAKVLGWVVGDKFVTSGALKPGESAALVLDRTNFYAESGGQVGDRGVIVGPTGRFAVQIAKSAGHCVLHIGEVESGWLAVGETVTAEVHPERFDIRRNHTATHLLNWALRQTLGEGVEQAGSVVDAVRLRFDFTHKQAMTDEQLDLVERIVNDCVLGDEPVHAQAIPLSEARKIGGVRAVFGEKYPDPVRVISVGVADPVRQANAWTPVEFCGGTHLDRTSQVGLFKIVSEESVARGVRRITAVTGPEAVRQVQSAAGVLREVGRVLRVGPEAIPERLAAMQAEIKQLRKQRTAGASAGLDAPAAGADEIGGVKVIVTTVPAGSAEEMRSMVDQLRQKAGGPAAVLIGAAQDDKVTLLAGLSEEVVKQFGVKAGDWVKAVAVIVGGSGGGKPTLAQAGGKDPAKLPEALAAGKDWIKAKLS